MDTNEADLLADGTVVDVGFQTEAKILKLNFQPSNKHQIQLTGVDAPMDKLNTNVNSGDRFTPCDCLLEENLYHRHLVVRGQPARRSSRPRSRPSRIATTATLRCCGRSSPERVPSRLSATTFPYQDQITVLRFNAITQGAGLGYIDTNRDQANASVSLFRGDHDFKFGVDYQDVSSETLNIVGVLFRGRGYNENLPGGFAQPQDKRVFDPSNAIESTSEVYSAYAQDRFDLSERFNLYIGVRMDSQAFDNDAGQEIISSTDFVPRLAATWDTTGDGTVLLKATAGRYYQVVGQDIFNREFATLPNGQNQSTLFRWNNATQRYDLSPQRTLLSGLDTGSFDPYYKDEVSAGVEWQFVPTWAFKARAIWWEIGDAFWSTNQFNAAGQVVSDVRNWDDGFRDYRGAVLELNRAFRNGWTVRTNYTYSDGDGNTFGTGDGTTDADTLFELLGGVEVCTATSAPGCTPGATNATIRNREGSGNTEREHNLNLVGLKAFEIGKQTLGLGGYFGFRSGEPWGLRANTSIRHPVSNVAQTTTTYVTPRDANEMEDTYTLNLTGYWEFPIKGQFSGRLGVEAVNVTNEQEIISINLQTGQPDAGKSAIQSPREIRLQVGLTF